MRTMIRRAVKAVFAAMGYDIQWRRRFEVLPTERETRARRAAEFLRTGGKKVHYGSGGRVLGNGWLNLDLAALSAPNFLQADLTEPHPFPDGSFRYGFAEDFLEHLDQEQSLRFLIETHRTLQPGGVLRLSFPDLEGVLRNHYTPPTMKSARAATNEAYENWGHKHFYAMDELRIVARHLGFSEVNLVEHGCSIHTELRGLDQRDQIGLNAYVELVK